MTEQGYAAPDVCKIVGITYRQLDYWARTELVTPSVRDASGSGTQRLYSFQDPVTLRVIKNLLDTGVSLQRVRIAVEHLHGIIAALDFRQFDQRAAFLVERDPGFAIDNIEIGIRPIDATWRPVDDLVPLETVLEIAIFLLVMSFFLTVGQTVIRRMTHLISLAVLAASTAVGHWVIAARIAEYVACSMFIRSISSGPIIPTPIPSASN